MDHLDQPLYSAKRYKHTVSFRFCVIYNMIIHNASHRCMYYIGLCVQKVSMWACSIGSSGEPWPGSFHRACGEWSPSGPACDWSLTSVSADRSRCWPDSPLKTTQAHRTWLARSRGKVEAKVLRFSVYIILMLDAKFTRQRDDVAVLYGLCFCPATWCPLDMGCDQWHSGVCMQVCAC